MVIRKQWTSIVWAIIILIITGLPGELIPEVSSFLEWLSYDKIVHLFVFAVLTILILYNARTQYLDNKTRYTIVIVAVMGSALFGLLTEVLQHYVFIGRSGNVYDTLADFLGAIIGWLLFKWAYRKKILDNSKPTEL